MTATECVNFERNYKYAREHLNRINDAWTKFLIKLPRRIWINTKTHESKVEYKFGSKWQTAEEISEQTLKIYKLTEDLTNKYLEQNN